MYTYATVLTCKTSETGWEEFGDPVSEILDQKDDGWISKGIDVSVIFKRGLSDALKTLKKAGKDVDITYNEASQIPNRWHECHEPPIRFVSERKDQFYRRG
jgi:hypothetical protein